MAKPIQSIRIAAVTTTLDWTHRWVTSNEKFNLQRARDYIERRVQRQLRLMEESAISGATLVVGPEYFRGSELFTTTPENKRDFVETADGDTVQRMRDLSQRRGVYLAAAMDMWHEKEQAFGQTGVITGPKGDLVGLQVKNTAVPENSPLRRGHVTFDLDIGKAAIFTCSDLTTFPEDTIPLAKAGMQLLLVPGCGFAGKLWKSYLEIRSRDLRCVTLYADDGRAAIIDRDGSTLGETHTPDAILCAETEIMPKEPTERLRALE